MKKITKTKTILCAFLLVFSIFLSSCSNPVTYSVEKEHKDKMEVIYNMISGLLENDSKLYLSTIEPKYIENVKKVVDTLGLQYFSAASFDELIKTFFAQYQQGLEANYGKNIKVSLSFDSVTTGTKDSLGVLIDDYSVGYQFPKDDMSAIYNVSVKLNISGSSYSGEKTSNFVLFEMNDGNIYLHPDSFLYSF
jgi:hypothetical protein